MAPKVRSSQVALKSDATLYSPVSVDLPKGGCDKGQPAALVNITIYHGVDAIQPYLVYARTLNSTQNEKY